MTSHHPEAPTIPTSARVVEEALSHLAGFDRKAQLEAGPRKKSGCPCQTAAVADLLEGGRGLTEPALGLLCMTGVERAPRKVLMRPGHTTLVLERG